MKCGFGTNLNLVSVTKAAELAKMYPEILTNAQFSANGQYNNPNYKKCENMPEMTYYHITMMIWSVTSNGESNRLKISEEVTRYRLDIANQIFTISTTVPLAITPIIFVKIDIIK